MGRRNRRIPNLERMQLTDIGNKGKALGRHDERVVFVTGGVPGDVVDVQVTKKRRNYLEGKVIKIHEYSPDRVEPECQYFGICGGCKWQNLDYSKQLEYKEKEVRENLKKIGHVTPEEFQPILGSTQRYFYRNKLEFSFTDNKWLTQEQLDSGQDFPERRGAGFHIPGFWDKVLDIDSCHLQPDPSNAIRNYVRDWAIEKDLPFFHARSQEGWLRTLMIRVASTGEVLVLIQFKCEMEQEREALLADVAAAFPKITTLQYVINEKQNDTIYDQDIITYSGSGYIEEAMPKYSGNGELRFKIGPKSFYQTNPLQAHELYKVALDMADIQKDDVVFDLYTGTGTIALFMAEKAKEVVGIELIPEAILDAKTNAMKNGIENATFYDGDMKNVFTEDFIAKHGKPNVIITDPPRDGMHADVVQSLLDLEIQKIVYVSCNSATQARDLGLLKEKYEVTKSKAVDMFPQTHHIENVVQLVLKA
ncbi:23S rRNA (uracil(1939)-C(5))-methyltransferase RlmD [Schleiferiaceae bacterium]|nr:23S rRNA (uracil(1939)-C(5))-methyltransferase RlmD [Schleiferiaceae bacterium]|tara:strand:- start:1174 stop:2604 length:1431 start_codon:yes stop_codon:yes gene_type:complete